MSIAHSPGLILPPNVILQADVTKGVPWTPGLLQLIVTSPPYWGQRRYGDSPDELGGHREPRELYLQRLVQTFRHCWDAMDDGASLFVNIADTSSKSGGAGGDYNRGGSKVGKARWKQGDSGLPALTVCNVPGTFVDMMLADGWLLRATIVWDKGRERAEDLNHVRRVRPSHEFIFHFVKSKAYRFYRPGLETGETGSVWHFAPEKSGDKGSAPFPLELPRRCIAMSVEPGMAVGDPFCGSGTTIQAAVEYGCTGYGLDLYAGQLFG